jgi:hypothetical protein
LDTSQASFVAVFVFSVAVSDFCSIFSAARSAFFSTFSDVDCAEAKVDSARRAAVNPASR